MPLPFPVDFKNPDYTEIFDWRVERLKRIIADPQVLFDLNLFYKTNPVQFITDWGVTSDPRNIERGLPAVIPFILFPRQEELAFWVLERWRTQTYGGIEKSRDMGVTWLMMALFCAICLFNEGVTIGIGSRKEEYIDRIGDPKCLFYKLRQFMRLLPPQFRRGWNPKKHSPYMRLLIPDMDSSIIGEAGDNVGRGARTSIFGVDEAAHFQRPELIDAALSETTNCRIDISTPRGTNNPFARRKMEGKHNFFTYHWRDDPRKDDAWYKKKCEQIGDPVIIAQELDLDYTASLEGVLIPALWVRSAVDAHIKLNIKPTGVREAALDIADEGKDVCAIGGRHGILLEHVESWSGKNLDTFYSMQKSFDICDQLGYPTLLFDSDGLGAGCRGIGRVINEKRQVKILVIPFRGSGAVIDPTREVFKLAKYEATDKFPSRTNEDYFLNLKAQAWWALRQRFYVTYRAIMEGAEFDPEMIISISSTIPCLNKLLSEISQPTFKQSEGTGKMFIDKMPEGARSPNLADTTMMLFAPRKRARAGFFNVD